MNKRTILIQLDSDPHPSVFDRVVAVDAGAAWAAAGHGALGVYARLVVFGGGGLLAVGLLPVIAKWLLIGRWKPREIRVWSLGYVRFWIVKMLVRSNPLAFLSVGSPLYTLYLRALGAKIGPGVAILNRVIALHRVARRSRVPSAATPCFSSIRAMVRMPPGRPSNGRALRSRHVTTSRR